jgi:hypothetical protein
MDLGGRYAALHRVREAERFADTAMTPSKPTAV